jgi:hypothetical protein
MSFPRLTALAVGLLAVVVIESGMRFPWQSVDVGGGVPPGPRAAHARGDERGNEPAAATLKPPRAPAVPVERLTAVDAEVRISRFGAANAPRDIEAHGDGGHAQRTYEREADRERMERKIRRCKYLAEISRVARRDVLVEIMYERARLGCAGLGY